jgi:F-type H+-transporting ATPase subunit b
MALLRVDPGLIIWLWILFGVLLLVLRLTVWDTITGALDKRSQKIASSLDAARQAGLKAETVLAEYEAKIREGKAEAARIIESARGEASRLKEEILNTSQAETREMKERAAREIQKSQEDAEKALRAQVVALSFSIADAILKRETGTPDNHAFVEEFADKLVAGPAGAGPSRN